MLNRLAALTIGASALGLPALAQAAPSESGPSIISQILLFLPLILIFYFLLMRPQQQRAKKHKAMVEGLKRGDTVVTSGGLVGKVTKAGDTEITVELGDNMRVQMIKAMVIEVRGKNDPVPAND